MSASSMKLVAQLNPSSGSFTRDAKGSTPGWVVSSGLSAVTLAYGKVWNGAHTVSAKSMTVWYRPDSSSTTGVRLWYPTASGSASVDMAKACDGYYSAKVPVTGSSMKLVAQLNPSSGSFTRDAKGSTPGWVVSSGSSAVTLAYGNVYNGAHT
ncbi:hypothetical protein, partial [Pseudoscardovia suis]|uniref:hypothetical protein n=1 Tax=Pseudoscardovia suis TaxID=987063 RepID=UPI003F9B3702